MYFSTWQVAVDILLLLMFFNYRIDAIEQFVADRLLHYTREHLSTAYY